MRVDFCRIQERKRVFVTARKKEVVDKEEETMFFSPSVFSASGTLPISISKLFKN